MKRKKFFKKIFLFSFVLTVGLLIFCSSYFFVVTKDAKIDTNKFNLSSSQNVKILDAFDNEFATENLNKNCCTYGELQPYTIYAFTSIEDKRFFEHCGVDYIRILGAIKNNILHPSRKQGGSTITQQLVKNVQLDNSKTISRKLKEIKLARELEKKYSKQQIMELYLNTIYFGNGCYGIENASKFYFDKSAKDLSVAESAMLASIINAPRIYDPVEHFDNANSRKNLVLKMMKQQKKIDDNEYNKATSTLPQIEKSKSKYISQYYDCTIDEACKILHVTENQLKNMNVEIKSYFDENIQNIMKQNIENFADDNNIQIGSIAIDNESNGVVALASNKKRNMLAINRQPGSIIKPILVYAPAFESKKYSPATFVEDKQISIDGYQPENANKKYLGVVNVREAISKSINTTAVEVLDTIGLQYAKNFAKNFGITFDKNDNNLALALGGFTKGVNIKQLADAYSCFANLGKFKSSSFIREILIDGVKVYSRTTFPKTACKESTAYLVNSCLMDTAKFGTAKRLKTDKFEVCSKTGTVGDSSGNSDAYNVAYTTKHTFCTWFGSNDNTKLMNKNYNGATYPTIFNKSLIDGTYSLILPKGFIVPDSIKKVGLSEDALAEHKIEEDPKSLVFDYFDKDVFVAKSLRSNLETILSADNFENNKPILKFSAKRTNLYQICRINDKKLQFLKEVQFQNDAVVFEDKTAEKGKLYEYFIVAKHGNQSKESNHIKLIAN